jgi:HEAT repeat protein
MHNAAKLTGRWPPAAAARREVSIVARHGRAAVPLLLDLLSDDRTPARRRALEGQQRIARAEPHLLRWPHCGRTYCDGDPPERIARVKAGWLRFIASDAELRSRSARELLGQFQNEPVFWQQLEIGRALAATADRSAVAALEGWLAHDDRHRRGNAAYVLGRLGDRRGFDTIAAILADRAPRGIGQGIAAGRWSLRAQIRADRYHAAHLLGDLKDPRGVARLVPLLNDADVNAVVPWALAEIGDGRGIGPLIELRQDDPSRRVYAILARDTERSGLPALPSAARRERRRWATTSVAEAARRAIAIIAQRPRLACRCRLEGRLMLAGAALT